MTPKHRKRAAWVLLVACFIAWPCTALTVFADEPQGILGLSFLALILTALDILATSDTREAADDSAQSEN